MYVSINEIIKQPQSHIVFNQKIKQNEYDTFSFSFEFSQFLIIYIRCFPFDAYSGIADMY